MAQKRAQMMAAALRGAAPEPAIAALPTPENIVLPAGAGGQRVGQTSGLGALIKNYKWAPKGTPAAGAAGSFFDAAPGVQNA
jgi:hypothetical protein